MGKKNPHVGSSLDDFLKEQMKDEEFARHFVEAYSQRQIADAVRRIREESNMTQLDLANAVGTKQPSIARLEAGKTHPTLDLLLKIALATGRELIVSFSGFPPTRLSGSTSGDQAPARAKKKIGAQRPKARVEKLRGHRPSRESTLPR